MGLLFAGSAMGDRQAVEVGMIHAVNGRARQDGYRLNPSSPPLTGDRMRVIAALARWTIARHDPGFEPKLQENVDR